MARNRRFLGCQYPLVKTARGILAQKSGVAQIKADLLQLLLTTPGERVMLPEFGVPLRRLIFEPNDPTLAIEARNMIASAIEKWEKRIDVQGIQVSAIADEALNKEDTKDEKEHILSVRIMFYDPIDISEIQELVLEVPISNSGG